MKSNLAKKQLTMVTLVLALALAVYLNWRFAKAGENALIVTETLAGAEGEQEKYYGDALFVSSTEGDPGRYFAEARLNRETSRAEALDTLEKSLQNTDLTDAEKESILAQLSEAAANIATESNIESLIKAKGFSDCVAFISGDRVKVVVQSGGGELTAGEVSQIKEIVLGECGVPAQNITIVEIK
jgi:stage III sporulation protein AH